MNTRFKILVLRLLLAIYKHQLGTLRVYSDARKVIITEVESFIEDLAEKENE